MIDINPDVELPEEKPGQEFGYNFLEDLPPIEVGEIIVEGVEIKPDPNTFLKDIDSNIEVPRGADNTVLDYTGLGLDIEFPNKSGISAVGEDLIDFSELDIRSIDEGNLT